MNQNNKYMLTSLEVDPFFSFIRLKVVNLLGLDIRKFILNVIKFNLKIKSVYLIS
jgi:hypothetical protein